MTSTSSTLHYYSRCTSSVARPVRSCLRPQTLLFHPNHDRLMKLLLFSFLLVFESFVSAQDGPTTWTATPFNPPSFPLAVKTPYVNAWDPQGNEPAPVSNSWPRGGSPALSVMGWYSMISVDGKVYRIMGGQDFPGVDVANQVAISMTPTRTSVLFEAGPVTVNATYLSPVEVSTVVLHDST